MRRIAAGPIAVFTFLAVLAAAVATGTVRLTMSALPSGPFAGLVALVIFVVTFFVACVVENRLFLRFCPLNQGELREGSTPEFVWHVNVLFYLVVFNSLIRTRFVPVPLMRVVYLMLGAKLGANTYTAGTILDPQLTTVGSNTLLGQDSIVFCHAIEGQRLSLAEVRIGSGVTVGANSVIMAGVTIGDRAMVAAGSVVQKDTKIDAGEVWGGVPARRLRAAGED